MRDDAYTEQLDQVVALVGEVLGPDVVGAYLHGSTALGRLQPRSDLDVLAVSRRPTTLEEKGRLVHGLFEVSSPTDRPGPRRPIELTIVVASEIRPWRYPPRFDFLYGEWLRQEFTGGNLEPWETTTSPDLAPLITMVLQANRRVLGPPPADVFDAVPPADLEAAVVTGIDGLLGDLESDTRNVLLTLARIWVTVATGTIRSKDEAASWALARLPDEHRPVLTRARAIYLGDEEERWEDLQTRVRPHAEHVVREIQRLAASTPGRPEGRPGASSPQGTDGDGPRR